MRFLLYKMWRLLPVVSKRHQEHVSDSEIEHAIPHVLHVLALLIALSHTVMLMWRQLELLAEVKRLVEGSVRPSAIIWSETLKRIFFFFPKRIIATQPLSRSSPSSSIVPGSFALQPSRQIVRREKLMILFRRWPLGCPAEAFIFNITAGRPATFFFPSFFSLQLNLPLLIPTGVTLRTAKRSKRWFAGLKEEGSCANGRMVRYKDFSHFGALCL